MPDLISPADNSNHDSQAGTGASAVDSESPTSPQTFPSISQGKPQEREFIPLLVLISTSWLALKN